MKSALLSQKMHSGAAAAIMVAVGAFFVAITAAQPTILPPQADLGLALPSPGVWPIPAWVGTLLNIALNLAIMLMMVLVNKAFNVLRAVSKLQIGLFALMQAAVPREVTVFNSGSLLALAVICCIFLLFSCYDEPTRVRRVFLAFLILSLGAAMQYCFLIFLPVFLVICAQMRIFNLRTISAAFLGTATVWILLLGFGQVRPENIHFPHITPIFASLNLDAAWYLLTASGLTALLLLASTLLNVMKTISYNARARAYNGALILVNFVAVGAMAINFDNVLAYLPLLNMCSAYQLTHYFVTHRFERQYVAVLSIGAAYVLLYLWRVTI